MSRPKRSGSEILGLWLARALISLFGGWMLMLLVAIVHEHWITAVPGIGYWWAVLLLVTLRATVISCLRFGEDDKT